MALSRWTAGDSNSARQFFGQPTGIKILERLRANIPKITAKKMDEATLEAIRKQGAENMYDALLALTESAEPEFKEGRDFVNLNKEGD